MFPQKGVLHLQHVTQALNNKLALNPQALNTQPELLSVCCCGEVHSHRPAFGLLEDTSALQPVINSDRAVGCRVASDQPRNF